MVGIHRKVKQLLQVIEKYSPLFSNFIPGLGNLVGSVSELGEEIADGVNNVYNDYNRAQKNKRSYNFLDGVKSFVKRPKDLTSSLSDNHTRIKLKE
jgi:hypothetical protein